MQERIKKLRQERGLTQLEVATAIGISERHYQYLESGKRKGMITIWSKLADFFGVTLDYLVSGKEKTAADISGIGSGKRMVR